MLSNSNEQSNHAKYHTQPHMYHQPLHNNKPNEHKLSSSVDSNTQNTKFQFQNKHIDIICVPNIRPSQRNSKRKKVRRAKTLDADTVKSIKSQHKHTLTHPKGSITPHQSPKLSPKQSPTRKRKSKLRMIGARARLKLTKTQSTDQPKAIIQAKGILKAMKRLGGDIEEIATNLYMSHHKSAELTHLFSDKLSNMSVTHNSDRFAVFLNNIGLVSMDINTEKHRFTECAMKDEFITPLQTFNHGSIESCKELKLKLRRIKAEYDMVLREENKLKSKQLKQIKNVNLANVHILRQKSKQKLEKLETIRDAFIDSVTDMECESVHLLQHWTVFMSDYAHYALKCSDIFESANANAKEAMYHSPANVNNCLGLDSDTEDMNDHSQTISTLEQWSKETILLKEGFIQKKSSLHNTNHTFETRWFRLFANRKMVYFTDNRANSPVRGHINLTKMDSILKKGHSLLELQNTKYECGKQWILQFADNSERDIWYAIINSVAVTKALQSIAQSMDIQNYVNAFHTPVQSSDEQSMSDTSICLPLPPNISSSTSLYSAAPLIVMRSLDESCEDSEEKKHSCPIPPLALDKAKKATKFLSLSEIVSEVTSAQLRGTKDQIALIQTYCLYSTREALLDTIFARLSLTSDPLAQIKVFGLLRTWLKLENDFKSECENGLSPFALHFSKELLLNTSDSELLQRLARPIIQQISALQPRDSRMLREQSITSAPTARIPSLRAYKTQKDLELSAIDSTELARQITLMEYAVFKRIKCDEFLTHKKSNASKHKSENQNIKNGHNLSERLLLSQHRQLMREDSLRKVRESPQPNIDAIKAYFNKLVAWAQIEILGQSQLEQRVKCVTKLLKVCGKLLEFNNISSLCAVRAGLCSVAIHRLRQTWNCLPKKARDIKERIDDLFRLENNQRNLRDHISVMRQPAIPHIGVFLADIVFINDGNLTFANDGSLINWHKMQLFAERINWISMFQQSPFVFQRVDIIQKYLQSKMKIVSEDFLYKLSQSIEAPLSQKKKTV